VCIGLATPSSAEAWRYRFAFDDRAMNKQVFAATALNRLRRALIKSDENG
jgi:nicotinamide-nucleotide amidase